EDAVQPHRAVDQPGARPEYAGELLQVAPALRLLAADHAHAAVPLVPHVAGAAHRAEQASGREVVAPVVGAPGTPAGPVVVDAEPELDAVPGRLATDHAADLGGHRGHGTNPRGDANAHLRQWRTQ